MDMIEKARIFATAAHAAVGQLRKYTNEPYIVHPTEVANIVRGVPGTTPEMISAAYLHDTVEDTNITADTLREEFGDEITELVIWLTDVSKPEDGNRATRKAIDLAKVALAPPNAQTIKLADIISNITSIVEHDPDFAIIYLKEKRAQLEVLKEGNQELYKIAYNLLYT